MPTPIGVNWADIWEDVWAEVWVQEGEGEGEPRILDFIWDASSGTQAFAWDASSSAQSFTWAASEDDMATTVEFDVIYSGETISLVGTPTTPCDVTAWTLRARIFDREGGHLIATPAVVKTTPETGVLTIPLEASETVTVRSSSARDEVFVDLWRVDVGSERALMRGTLPVWA
jgi:hypothetical protein